MVGLLARLSYVLFIRRDHVVWGDALFYHAGARLLVEGHGFIAPLQYHLGETVQAADHPPLYLLYLAVPSLVGLTTPFQHMLWSVLLGTATVVVVAFLARRVAGDRAGLIAAALAALYPNVWLHDGALLSETMAIFCVSLTLLLAYRAWDDPSYGRIVALGAACGAAALARSELVLLVPALLVPVVLARSQLPRRDRLRRLGVGVLVSAAVLLPWVGYNLTRFERPVLLSSQLEQTLVGANCRDTYRGDRIGYISLTCLRGFDIYEDQSVEGAQLREKALDFIGDHLDRVPAVMAARVGRVVGVYRVPQQLEYDSYIEGRERWVAILALVGYYTVAVGAIAGAVVLRRRRSGPLFPLLVAPAIVVVTVAFTYGTPRFRAVAETSLVVLAAVALDALLRRRQGVPADT